MRISDWSSDVCSSDLPAVAAVEKSPRHNASPLETAAMPIEAALIKPVVDVLMGLFRQGENLRLKSNAEAALREAIRALLLASPDDNKAEARIALRSQEHPSELQSLLRISYAVFCSKKKTP